MYFAELHAQLLTALRRRLGNGDLTERRLARLTGISQPHIHNVLKGKRVLSFQSADIVLKRSNISILDLLAAEAAPRLCAGCGGRSRCIEVPVLSGWVGPGLPLPRETDPVEKYPFPSAQLATVDRPLVARLADDPRMRGRFRENDLALLDHSPARRSQLRGGALYLVNRRGEGLIRRVTREREDLLVLRGAGPDAGARPEALPLGSSHLLDAVLARVAWIGGFLESR